MIKDIIINSEKNHLGLNKKINKFVDADKSPDTDTVSLIRQECPHGTKCYRVNPAHLAEFSHPIRVAKIIPESKLKEKKVDLSREKKSAVSKKTKRSKLTSDLDSESDESNSEMDDFIVDDVCLLKLQFF